MNKIKRKEFIELMYELLEKEIKPILELDEEQDFYVELVISVVSHPVQIRLECCEYIFEKFNEEDRQYLSRVIKEIKEIIKEYSGG